MKKQTSMKRFGFLPAVVLWAVFLLIFLTPGFSAADTYEYDELNRLTRVVYDDGKDITYTYDAAGNITATEVKGNEQDEDHDDDSGDGGGDSGGGGICFITTLTDEGFPLGKN